VGIHNFNTQDEVKRRPEWQFEKRIKKKWVQSGGENQGSATHEYKHQADLKKHHQPHRVLETIL
jgi:hypothetical protein